MPFCGILVHRAVSAVPISPPDTNRPSAGRQGLPEKHQCRPQRSPRRTLNRSQGHPVTQAFLKGSGLSRMSDHRIAPAAWRGKTASGLQPELHQLSVSERVLTPPSSGCPQASSRLPALPARKQTCISGSAPDGSAETPSSPVSQGLLHLRLILFRRDGPSRLLVLQIFQLPDHRMQPSRHLRRLRRFRHL